MQTNIHRCTCKGRFDARVSGWKDVYELMTMGLGGEIKPYWAKVKSNTKEDAALMLHNKYKGAAQNSNCKIHEIKVIDKRNKMKQAYIWLFICWSVAPYYNRTIREGSTRMVYGWWWIYHSPVLTHCGGCLCLDPLRIRSPDSLEVLDESLTDAWNL